MPKNGIYDSNIKVLKKSKKNVREEIIKKLLNEKGLTLV